MKRFSKLNVCGNCGESFFMGAIINGKPICKFCLENLNLNMETM